MIHGGEKRRKNSREQRKAYEFYRTATEHEGQLADMSAAFDRALASLHMVYQPIVCWSQKKVYGHESLVRNDEPCMRRPDRLFDAAQRLQRLPELGRIIRRAVARTLAQTAPTFYTFVNLHPLDLLDPELLSADAPLSQFASSVVLEVTERAALSEVPDVLAHIAQLRALGFRIALDDLGAGYAGLASFAQLQPDMVKVDMSLVRNIDQDLTKQTLVRSINALCREFSLLAVMEGVETKAERDALLSLGCDHLQGYLFGKPARRFLDPCFEAAA